MKKVSALQIINVLALIATLVMNGLSQTDLFPNTVGDLGESRAIFFLPAGYVFAIWGVIYTGLIAYSIYQARPSERNGDVVNSIGWWFVASCIANIAWLALFLYDLVWLSTIAMIAIIIPLIIIYTRLGIGVKSVSLAEKWAVHIPFSIYLGWVSVATVANFSTALYTSGYVTSFAGINADIWASIMLVVAGVLALTMLYFRRDVAYALVIVWASYGINARPFDTDLYSILSNLDAGLVDTMALSIAIIVAIASVITLGFALMQSQKTA
ncbi:MAG: hypothetical protein Phog2KO_14450 [Phototrophicaceae bacterium]